MYAFNGGFAYIAGDLLKASVTNCSFANIILGNSSDPQTSPFKGGIFYLKSLASLSINTLSHEGLEIYDSNAETEGRFLYYNSNASFTLSITYTTHTETKTNDVYIDTSAHLNYSDFE